MSMSTSKNIICPITIIDPRYDDDDNRLITTIFNPEKGAEYLNYLRKEYESTR